eukprot:143717_1
MPRTKQRTPQGKSAPKRTKKSKTKKSNKNKTRNKRKRYKPPKRKRNTRTKKRRKVSTPVKPKAKRGRPQGTTRKGKRGVRKKSNLYNRKSTAKSYAQGDGSAEKPYRQDHRNALDTQKQKDRHTQWPVQKALRRSKRNEERLKKDLAKEKAQNANLIDYNVGVGVRIEDMEESIQVVMEVVDKQTELKNKLLAKYEAAQFELQSVLDAAEQVTDCDDEDVYIEIGDGESDEDEEKDDNHDMLFGVQANANKKYKHPCIGSSVFSNKQY